MDFICPICEKGMPRELRYIVPHTEEHIVEEIKKKHPKWVDGNGVCKKCYEYYKKQMNQKQ